MQLPHGRIRVRWWILGYLCLYAMLAYVQRTTLPIAADRIMAEFGLSQMQVGWLMWAFTVTYMVGQLPGGVLGQRIGGRLTYIAIGVVSLIATVATPLAPYMFTGAALFVALALAQGLLGAAQGPVFPVYAGVMESWFPVKRWALANGLNATGMNIGSALTPLLLVPLILHIGWQQALLWTALPTALLTLLWAWYARDTPQQHPSVTPAELGEAASEPKPPLTVARLLKVLSNRDVLLLTLSYTFTNYAFYLITNWTFLYLIQERHLTALNSGALAALPPVGAAIGAWLGGELADRLATRFGARWGYRLVPLVTLPIVGALLLLVIRAGDPYLAIAALTLAFAGVEFNEGPYWAATMAVARADTMAATGVLNTGGNLGGVIGIPIVAWLSGHGAWSGAFATGTAFALLAAVLWLLIDSDRRLAEAPPAD